MPRMRNWLPWLCLAVVYLLLVAISWKRWANPIVDCGREMYVPWQIAEGKMLYRDLFFMYGPFVPYWHALLLKIFGVHLNVFYAVGLLITAVQASLVFVIGRRILTPGLACLASALFMAQFAFRPTLSNLVFPYSFNAEYASTLNLLTCWLVVRHAEGKHAGKPVFWGGLCAGLSLLSKQELGLACFAFLLIYAVVSIRMKRTEVRDCVPALAIALALPVIGYGSMAAAVGFGPMVHNYVWWIQIWGQMKFFEQYVVGTLLTPSAVFYVTSLMLKTVVTLAVILIGAWAASRYVHRLAGMALIAVAAILLLASSFTDPFFRYLESNHVYGGNVFFLAIALVVAIRSRSPFLAQRFSLLWIALFALLVTGRALLFAGLSSYSTFYMAASVIVFLWIWTEWAPRLWTQLDVAGWQRHAMLVFAILCLLQIGRNVAIVRTLITYPIATPRGEMFVHREVGPALDGLKEAILSTTKPDELVLLFPEETSLYFLCNRRSPSKYYQFVPALIASEKDERQLIRDADAARVRFASVSNRATTEYGKPYFGLDYYPHIREWLLANFHLVKTIGNPIRPRTPPPPSRFWPSEGYGIEIYERN